MTTRSTDRRTVQTQDGAVTALPERIEQAGHALTAKDLAHLLNVSAITLFKHCKAGRIPCFRIGTSVRFEPTAVARWLRGKLNV